jgi:hypothetical protein
VWYSWSDWEDFLDWMSLSGINLFLAMTGQEEVQYKVFQQLGLNDTQIRSWFNGTCLPWWGCGMSVLMLWLFVGFLTFCFLC